MSSDSFKANSIHMIESAAEDETVIVAVVKTAQEMVCSVSGTDAENLMWAAQSLLSQACDLYHDMDDNAPAPGIKISARLAMLTDVLALLPDPLAEDDGEDAA